MNEPVMIIDFFYLMMQSYIEPQGNTTKHRAKWTKWALKWTGGKFLRHKKIIFVVYKSTILPNVFRLIIRMDLCSIRRRLAITKQKTATKSNDFVAVFF
jgi:hypothetical protein